MNELLAPKTTDGGRFRSPEYREKALTEAADTLEPLIEKCLGRPMSLNEMRALLAWARKHRRERADYWEARVYRRMTQKENR